MERYNRSSRLASAVAAAWRDATGLTIRFYEFATGNVEEVAKVNKRLPAGGSNLPPGLSVSPDRRHFLFGAGEVPAGDLIMVENFRWQQ